MRPFSLLSFALCFSQSLASSCPFARGEVASYHGGGWPVAPGKEYVQAIDFASVEADLILLFKSSQTFWPADYSNYGPFFVRLAWHNAGSYRTTDGRGGADGGRQRFEPERSWDDNTNLDKARKLLQPIKIKYGQGLSWGDLIILAGNTAIKSMGGPILGFCAGRIDEPNGAWSEDLGPSAEQEALAPCPVNGKCERPLGSNTVGLIYLNPEGPMAQPIPVLTAPTIRDTFGRMAMNDTETVALIGGGHAFGKTHGACPAGAGPAPKDDPANPWPGLCGTGRGVDAFTSGFDGPWTTAPTTWDNEYFHNLLAHDWDKARGPGGHWQWKVVNGTSPSTTRADGTGKQNIMMMTSDISLLHDPKGEYQKLIRLFADEPKIFDAQFSHAWYKLTTRDMGPVSRCLGNDVPPVQEWQNPLPPSLPPSKLADFAAVKVAILKLVKRQSTAALDFDLSARLVRLAYRCAATFRVTDYLGGCNGARVRQSPQSQWEVNGGLDGALDLLQPIKDQFGDGLSWADLIVLAGSTVVESKTGLAVGFCGGRTDATKGTVSDTYLEPRKLTGKHTATLLQFRDYFRVMGLTTRELVALAARPVDSAHLSYLGYEGRSWGPQAADITNGYFLALLNNDWQKFDLFSPTGQPTGKFEFESHGAEGTTNFLRLQDLLIKYDPELQAIAQQYAADDTGAFKPAFVSAWIKLMNSDMFDGAGHSRCPDTDTHNNKQQTAGDEALPLNHPPVPIMMRGGRKPVVFS